jgi:hypothetical protein
MSVAGLVGTLLWLLIGFFPARFCFKVFMGPLFEKGRGIPGRMQYTMGDLYFLIGQIALAVLPISLSTESDSERAFWMIGIALYLSVAWAICCWMLSRVRVHNRKARLAAMLAFPFELAFTFFVWIAWPALLLSPLAALLMPLLLGLHAFASLSDWVFSKREIVSAVAPVMMDKGGAT